MRPEISICVPVYNQEKYIEKCLLSIINQDIKVSYEIVLADDCSSDGSREILQKYKALYSEKITLLLHRKNLGATQNSLSARAIARGKYICHCDGDDFYYEDKLRVQYEFLLSNPACIVAWHKVDLYREDGVLLQKKIKRYFSGDVTEISIEDLLAFGSWAANSSLMYKYDGIPFATDKYLMYDFEFSLKLLEKGRGALLPNVLGGYRVGSIGSLTSVLMDKKLNKQRVDQIDVWSQYVRDHKSYRKFVGFFSLLTIIKSIIKRERLSFVYFKHLPKILFVYQGRSIFRSIIKKIFN
jgi:glycosyltransferase involved in cell wall biosynthesis